MQWVRIWVDWPSLMPQQGMFNSTYVAFIDGQIRAAKRLNVNPDKTGVPRTPAVMLSVWRTPAWASGAVNDAASLYDRRARPTAAEPSPEIKGLEYAYPADVSMTSWWAFMISILVDRYHPLNRPLGDAWIDALEIMNEPNLQWWPQREPSTAPGDDKYDDDSTPLRAHRWAAKMIQTAREITRTRSNAPLIVVPAVSDIKGSNRRRTDYMEFTHAVLDRLDDLGFVADQHVAWSVHNYGDVTYNLGRNGAQTAVNQYQEPLVNRAARVRQILVNRGWRGWPAAGDPYVMITEGGAPTGDMKTKYGAVTVDESEGAQQYLVARNIQRMKTDGANTDGRGIGLLMTYMWFGSIDERYDTGLYKHGGGFRPIFATWANFP
jgi:hypothetical protein